MRNLDLTLSMTDRAVMDFTDVLSGFCSLSDAVVPHPKQNNLYLLTAPARLTLPELSEESMANLYREIRQSFDFCLVDAPAGLGEGFRLAINDADRAVVVTNTDAVSLRDAQRTVMELSHLPRGRVHLVVNRCRKKLMRSLHQTIDDAIDTAGLPLLGVVPEDETMMLFAGRGVPLLMSENHYAAQAYRNIARRLAGRRTPLLRIR